MTITQAIQAKDLEALEATVTKAVEVYKTAKPAEVNVDTVHGSIPFSSIWDEDTKWNVITAAYASIVQEVSQIPVGLDVAIETAKIISSNAVLRNVTGEPVTAVGGLL